MAQSLTAGDGEPQEGVSKEERGQMVVLAVPAAAHREGGLEGQGGAVPLVTRPNGWTRHQLQAGGLGGKERSNSQASCVGLWPDASAHTNMEPSGEVPGSTEAGTLANPEVPAQLPGPHCPGTVLS